MKEIPCKLDYQELQNLLGRGGGKGILVREVWWQEDNIFGNSKWFKQSKRFGALGAQDDGVLGDNIKGKLWWNFEGLKLHAEGLDSSFCVAG